MEMHIVAGVGLEPTTSGLWDRRANQLLPSRYLILHRYSTLSGTPPDMPSMDMKGINVLTKFTSLVDDTRHLSSVHFFNVLMYSWSDSNWYLPPEADTLALTHMNR